MSKCKKNINNNHTAKTVLHMNPTLCKAHAHQNSYGLQLFKMC